MLVSWFFLEFLIHELCVGEYRLYIERGYEGDVIFYTSSLSTVHEWGSERGKISFFSTNRKIVYLKGKSNLCCFRPLIENVLMIIVICPGPCPFFD